MKIIEAAEILRILPHRYPMLLIDRVIDFEPGVSLTAIKNVTINEPQFTGHYPDLPVMPGVLIVEAMAQATGVLAHVSIENYAEKAGSKFYLVAIDKCRFRGLVLPGDTLTFKVTVKRNPKRDFWKFDATSHVGNKLVASCEIMCAARK